jgi:hypothetical protein
LTHAKAAVGACGQALVDRDPQVAMNLDEGKVERMILQGDQIIERKLGQSEPPEARLAAIKAGSRLARATLAHYFGHSAPPVTVDGPPSPLTAPMLGAHAAFRWPPRTAGGHPDHANESRATSEPGVAMPLPRSA